MCDAGGQTPGYSQFFRCPQCFFHLHAFGQIVSHLVLP